MFCLVVAVFLLLRHTKTVMRPFFFRLLTVAIFLVFGFAIVSHTSPVYAGRTCCIPGTNNPADCNGCDTSIYWKNQGDDCGTDPTCRNCPGSGPGNRTEGNACNSAPPATGCRYFSFTPATITIEEGQFATVSSNVFADGAQIGFMRYTTRNATVATLNSTHITRYNRNVCCGWTYGYHAGGWPLRVNGETPGRTTILGEAVLSDTNGVCASGVLTVIVTAKATPTPVPTPSPSPTPTPPPSPTPPGCSCGAWVSGACGTGGCPVGSYPQTRTCTPSACSSQQQCVSNPACLPTASPSPTPTPVPTPTPLGSITSTIETDPSLAGGAPPQLVGGLLDPYCASTSTGTPFSAGTIGAQNINTGTNYPGSVNSGGTYTITNLPQASNAYCIKFNPSSANIVCTCPTGCQYCGKSIPTTQNLKFYVSPVGNSWYQTLGGEIGAQRTSGVALANPIPATCIEPFCNPYLSLPIGTDTRTIGALITTKTGNINMMAGTVGKTPDNRTVKLGNPLVCRENYDYFYRLYSMGLSPTNDFNYPSDASKPTKAPQDGRSAYFYKGSTLTISNPWTVSAGESIVIFVKGNLKIANTITVQNGGFLAFIVSGNIDIDSTVGTSDHASTTGGQVQGIYIANSAIRVLGATGAGVEKKFIGEGTFAACNGIKIDRDFARGGAGLDNNKYPGALFLYRPDFVKNTPDRMRVSNFVWREVNP